MPQATIGQTRLTPGEEDAMSDAIEALYRLCVLLTQRDQHAAAVKFAKDGNKLARIRHTRGQMGFTKFEQWL